MQRKNSFWFLTLLIISETEKKLQVKRQKKEKIEAASAKTENSDATSTIMTCESHYKRKVYFIIETSKGSNNSLNEIIPKKSKILVYFKHRNISLLPNQSKNM